MSQHDDIFDAASSPPTDQKTATLLYYRTQWQCALLLELILAAVFLAISVASFREQPWGLWAVTAIFTFLTCEMWLARAIGRLTLELCLCAAAVFVCVAIAAIYAPNIGRTGADSVFPVFLAVVYAVIFGLFTVGFLLKLRVLKMQV
ncbi:MAG: hypothetical protein FWD53_02570 [Phycisphaerales bacterium]|nr:hypothetical protein [Phycisphaerales bacterium]